MAKLNIIAVTACISGVAHTYMAAEHIEKLALQQNWSLQVETQGALGIENQISEADILNSDLVLFISNTNIWHRERFTKQRCLDVDISQFLLNDKRFLLKDIRKALSQPKGFHLISSLC